MTKNNKRSFSESFGTTKLLAFLLLNYFVDLITVSAKRLFSKTWIAVLITPLIHFLLWFSAKGINIPLFNFTYSLYGEISLTQAISTDLSIIERLTKILIIALPLSLTFFYFSYKEQKALAMSSVSFWNRSTVVYGLTSVLSIAFGTHLRGALNYYYSNTSSITLSQLNEEFSGRVIFLIVLSLLAIINGVEAIKVHLSNLNLSSQFRFALNEIQQSWNLLPYSLGEFQKDQLYKRINNNINALFQLLLLGIEKNTVDFYNEALIKWENALQLITEENPEILKRLILKQGKMDSRYISLQRSILKNQVNLISKLLSSHRLEEANYSFNVFLRLESGEQEYYTALHELAILCYRQGNLGLVLRKLNSLIENQKSKDKKISSVNSIYEQLLILAVEKNDIRDLSDIAHSLLKNIKIMPITNRTTQRRIPVQKLTSANQDEALRECILYMMIQTLVKSVEVSHYSCTGFLIKFIVSNFNGGFIKEVYATSVDNLVRDKNHENPYLKDNRNSNISASFNFNNSSLRYCFEKMSVLLYSQQRFVQYYNIAIDKSIQIEPYINISKLQNNINYLYKKILKVGDKYGLLVVSDLKFISVVKAEVINFTSVYKSSKQHNKVRTTVRNGNVSGKKRNREV
ncbi:hypothetical protein MHH60_26495 [Paenibacillus sp. FSL H7-0716]|uniref:Uncharacterized protein n=1 Tax=Paenibacillus odorifer TaxID=189426 RepID=A0AB36J650_9BACL|nr:hypothetical protein [Paenibacillus odorifer]OMD00926.1 hypothetical protein BJP46_19040 [Paenibacillus odorifer]OME11235.1 hypothetical protein BSK47_29525 [Paenibacillus odorifer]